MDKQDYTAAMETVMQADKDTLTEVSSDLDTLKAAFDDARAKFTAKLADYDALRGPAIGARQTITSIVSQMMMMDYTLLNIVQSVNSALSAYTPAPTPPAPIPQA